MKKATTNERTLMVSSTNCDELLAWHEYNEKLFTNTASSEEENRKAFFISAVFFFSLFSDAIQPGTHQTFIGSFFFASDAENYFYTSSSQHPELFCVTEKTFSLLHDVKGQTQPSFRQWGGTGVKENLMKFS